ncbi:MAG: hypothetical protein IJ766_00160 [Clostridia bacterium]|nr:hypothetical protein [Clostridia bacterium]
MQQATKCPVCGSVTETSSNFGMNTVFYECPTCGRFELRGYNALSKCDRNHLSSYLFYHRFKSDDYTEYRYHTNLEKETCDQYRAEFEQGNNTHGHPVHMDEDIVNSWFPRSFAEKVDDILLRIFQLTPHMGQQIHLSYEEMLSLFFIDRKERDMVLSSKTYGQWCDREEDDCINETQFILEFLNNSGYIDFNWGIKGSVGQNLFVRLLPSGYSRVDEIQKNTSYGRSALVAMKFGSDTIPLRESIRKGITDAGYIAIFIDEVQHNDFITPELLKHIRDSKFVVVDLTHQNNGAYFEEGYAMGLGKQVIQLCNEDTHLHFDVAQKNTIMWKEEADIPERLTNRIKATID